MPAAETLPLQPGNWSALSQYLASIPQIVNVKDPQFVGGAKGDGVTDDAAAIQAAITAAGIAGGIVFFPPGTYILKSLVNVPSNVTLRGSGMDISTLKAGASTQLVNINPGTANVAFEDMTFNGNRTGFGTGSDSVVAGNGNTTNLRMSNVKVTNSRAFCVFLNVASGGWTRGRITDCIFEDSGGGIDTFGSGQLTDFILHGCIFRNTTGQGFATTNSFGGIIISACHFEGPMGNAINLEPGGNVLIIGNHIHNMNTLALAIRITPVSTLSGVDPVNIAIVGNRIYNTGAVAGNLTEYGIFARNINGLTIVGNTITRMGREAVYLEAATFPGSTNTVSNVTISGNVLIDSNQDNAGGIANVTLSQVAGAVQDVTIIGNQMGKPGDGNAVYGVRELGTITRGLYAHNNFTAVLTAGVLIGSGTTTRVFQNIGFNPQGAAAISVTASPFTYTNADSVPEAVYVSGGTVSAIAKNAITVFAASPATVWLEPGEAVTVTYSVAPTMNKDRK